MPTYIWERNDWPHFRWDAASLLEPLGEARHRQGLFLGKMRDIGIDAKLEAELAALSEDVVKTSAIEGEVLNPASVRSSIARRLGIPDAGMMPTDRKVEGVVDIILDATKNYHDPLTDQRIFGWHAALFPTGYSGREKIDVAQWRTDSQGVMQVISNPFSLTPTIHFQAPPARRLAGEMAAFLQWFNGGQPMEPLLRAGLAHLWFVTIHPMDDGNGRIARAVTDLAVAQAERTGQRFYSMSGAIEQDKKHYYNTLESTQKGDLDITEWLLWFTHCYTRAILSAEAVTERVVSKARFWTVHADPALPPFNERQHKVLGKLLEGFDGFLTTKKWMGMCGCSQDTASRDIAGLVERGLLVRNPGGSKNTSYRFNWPPEPDLEAAPEEQPTPPDDEGFAIAPS